MTDLRTRRQLWYGEKKIGKTVQASRVPGGSFFLRFEEGHDHIEHHGVSVDSWETLIEVCNQLRQAAKSGEELAFGTLVVDTVGEAWRLCRAHILDKHKLDHESDAAFGKGYTLVENEFRRVFGRLTKLGFGVIFIAHTDQKEVSNGKKGAAERKWFKTVVDLTRQAQRFVPGLVDLLLFFARQHNEKTGRWERVIVTQGSEVLEAGVRYPPGWTRQLPRILPMDYSVLVREWAAGAPGAAPEIAPEIQTESQAKKPVQELDGPPGWILDATGKWVQVSGEQQVEPADLPSTPAASPQLAGISGSPQTNGISLNTNQPETRRTPTTLERRKK